MQAYRSLLSVVVIGCSIPFGGLLDMLTLEALSWTGLTPKIAAGIAAVLWAGCIAGAVIWVRRETKDYPE